MDNSNKRLGFIRFIPKLHETPATDTTPPDNVLEVNKQLQSCEDRIGGHEKLKSLQALRDKVYTRRVEEFHWDLGKCFELNGDYVEMIGGETGLNSSADIEEDKSTVVKLEYPLNAFLAVKTEEGKADSFWVARTLRIAEQDGEGNTMRLKVRWYQAKTGSEDVFSARYEMSTYLNGAKREYFDDTIDVRSILCQFESLTQRGGLHIRTQKAIRQCLNLN